MQTFIDFCAGIGCGRMGLELNGMQCLGFSEINPSAEITYRHFFGNEEINYGDLMFINPSDLPDFDLLIAGFPCQSFSIAGKRGGMNDERGQVIYGIEKILSRKKIKYFILENVKGLVNHEKGNTLKTIIKILENAGYNIWYRVFNSLDFGVPQMRERVYFIGIRKDLVDENFDFVWPDLNKSKPSIDLYLNPTEQNRLNESQMESLYRYLGNRYNSGKVTKEDLVKYDFQIIDTRQSDIRIYKGKSPTLRTGRHGILYSYKNNLYKLTGAESFLLQGIPMDKVKLLKKCSLSDQILLSQSGNAMTVNVITEISKNLKKQLYELER
jgi:DNA (cytosine-5)-methyltransferase 1